MYFCTHLYFFKLEDASFSWSFLKIFCFESSIITEPRTHLCHEGFSGLCSGLLWCAYCIITWLYWIFLTIAWFGEAFWRAPILKDVQFSCHQHAE